MFYKAALVNEPALMVPFSMSISSTVNDPSLMILLKLKVIVSNASNAFESATSFNQNIGSWDVGNATNMSLMFYKAALVNEPALMVPFSMSISSTVNDPSLMILL
jgi:surface protein